MAKTAFNKKTFYTSKLDVPLQKKLVKCYLEHSFVWCSKLDTSGKLCVMLEKDGERSVATIV